MTRRSTYACVLVLLPIACGGRDVEQGDTEGDTESTGSSDSSGNTTVTTTSPTTTMSTTDPATSDPGTTTVDPTGDSTSLDTSTGGGGNGCCNIHDAAGCDEPAVESCVCKAAADCCVFGWEKNCVDLAMNDCAATCMGTEESGESTTSEPPVGCDEPVVIELGATDATLTGDWVLVMSMLGEGMIAGIEFPMMGGVPEGTVSWDIDVPCDGDWYIWVRARDAGNDDSFFAQLDGEPDPAPIFEVDCTMGGDGYLWNLLNQRDPEMGMACEYVEDPWLASWTEGTHQLTLTYRDSIAVARIVVTNDETYEPM